MIRHLAIAGAIGGCGLFVLPAQRPAAPSVFTAAQAEAGKAAYCNACAKCHTDSLAGRDGTGEVPDYLRDYAGKIPPLAGSNSAFQPFLAKWGARTTKDLAIRIQEAIGGFPPKDRDENTYLNLTAYVLQVNGASPGTQALTAATAVEIRSIAAGVASLTNPPASARH
jgi:hypothetical protein